MLFYATILIILLVSSRGKYNDVKSFIPHLLLLLMIVLKGEVGCDFTGYLHRYTEFNINTSFEKVIGEYGWYLVEYITHVNGLDYQTYSIFAGVVGLGFLFFAQKKIQYIGFLVIIYQMIIVQLGLSGVRQFIAVCILTYATSIYLFGNQKSIINFLFLIILAASFHISALTMIFILPFIYKLNKRQIALIIIFCIIGLSSDIINATSEKYQVRYLEGTSVSAGAWIRFSITCIFIFFAIHKAPKRMIQLGFLIFVFGVILGIINSVGLHRFNYYFLPIVGLLLIKNYKLNNVSKIRMNYVYKLSVFYFLFWFTFSSYASCFIPYHFYFN